jgi:predicted  nucleic acid-binding Zn-ribbon protein
MAANNKFQIIIEAVSQGFKEVKEDLRTSLGAGSREATEEINRLNQRLKALDAEASSTQATLGKIQSFRKLKNESSELANEWKATEARLSELSNEIRTAEGGTKTLEREFNKTRKQAARLKTEYNENETALERMRRELSQAGVNTQDLSSEQIRLKNSLNKTQNEIKQTGQSFKAAQAPVTTFFTKAKIGATEFSRHLNENRKTGINWSGALRKAFATAAGSAGLGYLINRQLDMADATAKAADKIGVSTDALQEYRYAGERVGVNQRTLELGMQRFTRRMAEAADGSGELKNTLDKYNISVRDANGNMRSSEDVLGDLADAVQNAESESEQLRIAFKAFDSEGAALVNMLKNGSAGLEEYRQSARNLGIVVEEDLIRNSEKATDRITDLKNVLSSQLQRAITSLAPEIAKITQDFTDWIRIQGNLGEKLRVTVATVWEWTKAIGSFIKEYGKFIAGFAAMAFVIDKTRKLATVFGALNAAMIKVVGVGIIPWLKTYITQANVAVTQNGILTASFATLKGTIGLAAGALGSFFAGWQIGKMIGEIDIVERAVQGMYATIDTWITKARIKYLELKKAWESLWGDEQAVNDINKRIDQLNRHLDVIDLTKDKIKEIGKVTKETAADAKQAAEEEVAAEEDKQAAIKKTEKIKKQSHDENLKRINSELAALEVALDEQQADIELALAKREISEKEASKRRIQIEIDAQKQKIQVLKDALAKADELFKDDTEAAEKYKKELNEKLRQAEIDLTRIMAAEHNRRNQIADEAAQAQADAAKKAADKEVEAAKGASEQKKEIRQNDLLTLIEDHERQLEYIDALEQEGVIKHHEALQRKIQADLEFARAKVEHTKEAVDKAVEQYGRESDEYKKAIQEMKDAMGELAEAEDEAEERQKEAQESYTSWVAWKIKKIKEQALGYDELNAKLKEQQNRLADIPRSTPYVVLLNQVNRVVQAMEDYIEQFDRVHEHAQRVLGVQIDISNTSFDDLVAGAARLQEKFFDVYEQTKETRDGIDDIKNGITQWRNEISDADAAMDAYASSVQAYNQAWQNLFSDTPKTIAEIEAALDSVSGSYDDMVSAGAAAIDSLKSKWDELDDKIKGVEQTIRDLHKNTADTIRDLNRDLMSDEQAWLDTRKQAHEVYARAVQEMERGNTEYAKQLFDEARNLAKSLAVEIKDTEGNTIKSLESTTDVAISMLNKIMAAQESGLKSYMTSMEKQQNALDQTITKVWTRLDSTGRRLDVLKGKAIEFGKEVNSWEYGGGQDYRLFQFATGGPVVGPSHAAGGVPVEVEGGEHIQPKRVVKHYGAAIFEAFRNFRIPKDISDQLARPMRRFAAGGPVLPDMKSRIQTGINRMGAAVSAAPAGRMVFAAGGPVPSASGAPAGAIRPDQVIQVDFNFGAGRKASGQFSEADAGALVRYLKDAQTRSN